MGFSIQKVTAKDGNSTLIVNDLYIHSKYKPLIEVENIAKEFYKPHHLHVIYGYGLGYLVDELAKLCNFDEPILIIDPLLDWELLERNNSEYSRIYYIKHDDIPLMGNMVSQLTSYSNKVKIHIQQNYSELFTENLRDVLSVIRDAQIREIYNVNTVYLFSMQWQRNIFMNMKNIYEDNSIEDLYKKFDCPVVVASGGPSLTKQLPLIKEFRKKIILICAGTTINTLLNANIDPDYVVTIDGGEVNYNHFKDLKLSKTKIVYSPSSHYKIRESFEGKGYTFIQHGMESLKSYYKKKIDKSISLILGGGSVAHYAFSIAKKITTGPICLVGQDLAYTNNLSHAEGNKNSKSIEDNREIIELDGYYGGKVKSDDSLKVMLHTFEQLQIVDPHINENFNCTEGGAKIGLIKQLPFKEFLETYATDSIDSDLLKVVDNDTEKKYCMEKFIQNEINNYFKIIKLLDKGIVITQKESGPLFNQSTLNELGKIERKLNTLYTENNLEALLEPVIYENELKFLPTLNESKKEEFDRVKAYTTGLYQDCKKRILEFIDEIKGVMEEVENE